MYNMLMTTKTVLPELQPGTRISIFCAEKYMSVDKVEQ